MLKHPIIFTEPIGLFDPRQPRNPKGSPGGGQWTKGQKSSSSLEVIQRFASHSKAWLSSLTDAEIGAIEDYISDSDPINARARSGGR